MTDAPDRIDAYIAAQADFARPILTHIRALMHAASPDMGEAVKWGMPFFTYKDQNLANMAAFKGHAAFGFWHDKVGRDDASDDAMGQFGASPPAPTSLRRRDRHADRAGHRPDRRRRPPAHRPQVAKAASARPSDLCAALAASPTATAVWAAFPPGKIRDYCEWVNEARTDATRDKRIAQAVDWIAQGKGRNWKYEKK
ncbi:YdeI family protein [Sphingobium scionense]